MIRNVEEVFEQFQVKKILLFVTNTKTLVMQFTVIRMSRFLV